MITKPTTLLLGAGASCHLGFPLGRGLVDAILRVNEEWVGENWDITDFRSFKVTLAEGEWGSPDAFLETHREFNDLGKALIAHCLRKCEDPARLFPPQNNGWYSNLRSSLLAPTIQEFRKNRLSIVTFNYDRSIEHSLHRLVVSRFELDEADAWGLIQEVIPIIHVHGMLGSSYPDTPYTNQDADDPTTVKRLSEGIKIIYEIRDNDTSFCTPDFKTANCYLENAEAIYALGFSMSKTNMRRLRFFNNDSVRMRTVKCAIGSVHHNQYNDFTERVNEFGIKNDHLAQNTAQELLDYFIRL